MNIGIIGSGNIGSALARYLTNLGHQVIIANWRGHVRECRAGASSNEDVLERQPLEIECS